MKHPQVPTAAPLTATDTSWSGFMRVPYFGKWIFFFCLEHHRSRNSCWYSQKPVHSPVWPVPVNPPPPQLFLLPLMFLTGWKHVCHGALFRGCRALHPGGKHAFVLRERSLEPPSGRIWNCSLPVTPSSFLPLHLLKWKWNNKALHINESW